MFAVNEGEVDVNGFSKAKKGGRGKFVAKNAQHLLEFRIIHSNRLYSLVLVILSHDE